MLVRHGTTDTRCKWLVSLCVCESVCVCVHATSCRLVVNIFSYWITNIERASRPSSSKQSISGGREQPAIPESLFCAIRYGLCLPASFIWILIECLSRRWFFTRLWNTLKYWPVRRTSIDRCMKCYSKFIFWIFLFIYKFVRFLNTFKNYLSLFFDVVDINYPIFIIIIVSSTEAASIIGS